MAVRCNMPQTFDSFRLTQHVCARAVIPAPKLSVGAMRLSGLAFLALVALPSLPYTPAAWRAPMLGGLPRYGARVPRPLHQLP